MKASAAAIAAYLASAGTGSSYAPTFERGRFVPYLPNISQAKRRKRARRCPR